MFPSELILFFSFTIVIIIVYLLLRYGPVEHSWMGISKVHQKKLKKAQKEYLLKYGVKREHEEIGYPLYKKLLASHSGLAIYKEGIYAKFCLGSRGKYKFKKFDMFSGIFPVEIENPFTKTDSKWFGLKFWKELQIETKDYEVFLIDSRKHEFNTVIPILREAMGSLWDELYKENEIIRSVAFKGEVGWHSFIRSGSKIIKEKPRKRQKKEIDFFVDKKPQFSKNLKINKDRGALLLEESDEIIENRERAFRKLGAIVCAIGAILLLISVFPIVYLLINNICTISIIIVFLILGVGCFAIGIRLFQLAKMHLPVKIYENGILSHVAGTGEEVFIPFGKYINISEDRNIFEGEFYKVISKDERFNANLNKNIIGLEKYLDFIKGQIGKPELDYHVEMPGLKPFLRKVEYITYIIIIIISIVFGYYLSSSAFGESDEKSFTFGFLFLFALICIIGTFLAGLNFIFLYKKNKTKNGINLFVIGVLFIFALAVFFFNYYTGFFVWTDGGTFKFNYDSMPDNEIQIHLLKNDSVMDLNNNLILKNNEQLLLYNSTLIFNCTTDKVYSIWISGESYLELINCSLLSKNKEIGFSFIIHGKAKIVNCSINNLWGDENNIDYDGGIEIYSNSVEITNCTISNGKSNGIFIYKSSPLITGNTICKFLDDAIELHHSNATIKNNNIIGNEFAIYITTNSNPLISNNNINNNGRGITILTSSPIIKENTFLENSEFAIKYDSDSNPIIDNNIFTNNGEDIIKPITWGILFFQLCGIIIIIIAILFYIILFSLQKKYFQKDKNNKL